VAGFVRFLKNRVSFLFNDTNSNSDYIASNDRTNNELERLWKEEVMDQHKVLPQNLLGVAEENHKKPQSGYPASGPRFEPEVSRKRSRSANNSATTFGLKFLGQCSQHSCWVSLQSDILPLGVPF
jgi:hypothetical protein